MSPRGAGSGNLMLGGQHQSVLWQPFTTMGTFLLILGIGNLASFMAVRAALTHRAKIAFEDNHSKLDENPTTDDEPLVESLSGWCGGDFTGDVALESEEARELQDEVKFKNTLIEELQKSNHELRLKLAEAENKIAKMRVKIDSHCDCCSRGIGLEEDRTRYTSNDWSSTHSFGIDLTQSPSFWNKDIVKISDDNTNAYVKVKRWQDTFAKGEIKETESTSSSFFMKRSPNCLSMRSAMTRPESPATSGLTGDYIPVTPGHSTPDGQRSFEAEDSRAGSPQKHSMYTREPPQVNIAYGDHESSSCPPPTVKCMPGERIHQQHFLSPVPSRISTRDSLETQVIGQYRRAAQQTMQNIWVQHENHPRLSSWRHQRDVNGIVGKLLRDPDHKNPADLKNTS